ncbi:MAG TPA: FkbM family methyltransferase [Nocardioides sp.]|uniref:FkbM family methyltransferase n=1 Tax=Nocardioides sp. TaxID=35761 RepID=UPI002F40C59B
MALGPPLPDEPHGYRFWAEFTAAQARNTGKPTGVIDRRVRRFFHDLCRTVDPTLVLELGAHEGTFSTWAKGTFPEARCLALEANPYVHRRYREQLDRAGVDYRHLAAASTNGTVTVNIPLSIGRRTVDPEKSRMASLGIHRGSHEHEAVDVEAVRVDDLVHPTDTDRIVAWIDVEGASDAVLTGAREVLSRVAAVYIEVEGVELWSGQWLDVDVARFFRDLGKVPVMRDIQRRNNYNVVFVGEELAAQQQVSERAARVLRPPTPPRES